MKHSSYHDCDLCRKKISKHWFRVLRPFVTLKWEGYDMRVDLCKDCWERVLSKVREELSDDNHRP